MDRRLRELAFGNPLYGLTLRGQPPAAPVVLPPAPAGDAARGAAILAGAFRCAGAAVDPGEPDWFQPDRDPAAAAELHGFGWLDDLAAVDSDGARARGRELVADWLEAERGWSPVAWGADVLGRRCTAWLAHWPWLAGNGIEDRLLTSLDRQLRHLARVAGREGEGVDRLMAVRGLITGALSGFGSERRVARALDLLDRELARLLQSDGMTVERSPAAALEALAHLLEIEAMLAYRGTQGPMRLRTAIEWLANMVRFLSHGDGGLALFNGSNEGRPAAIAARLAYAGATAATMASGIAGFQRLAAGDTLVLVDAAAPPPRGFDRRAHAGTYSMEISVGAHRLVVNCGAHPTGDAAWREAQRTTAAHSTLVVDDTNSSEVLPGGGLGRRPELVECRREESGGNTWIEGSHDGYLAAFGLTYRRRLYLSAGGDDLRGEDALVGSHRGEFTLRFHLHPDVQATPIQNGAGVLLRLPSREHWKLQFGFGELGLARSIYLGRPGETRRNEQIVVHGRLTGEGATVKWALKRMPPSS